MFSDEFIANLPEDPVSGAKLVCEGFLEEHHTVFGGRPEHFDDYVEAYAFLASYLAANNLTYPISDLDGARDEIINHVCRVYSQINTDLDSKLTASDYGRAKDKYAAKLKNSFAYEFSEGDLTRIQGLINELRESISEYDGF